MAKPVIKFNITGQLYYHIIHIIIDKMLLNNTVVNAYIATRKTRKRFFERIDDLLFVKNMLAFWSYAFTIMRHKCCTCYTPLNHPYYRKTYWCEVTISLHQLKFLRLTSNLMLRQMIRLEYHQLEYHLCLLI